MSQPPSQEQIDPAHAELWLVGRRSRHTFAWLGAARGKLGTGGQERTCCAPASGGVALRDLSVEEQIARFRRGLANGIIARFHYWLLAIAVLCAIAALLIRHPLPLLFTVFFCVVALSDRGAGRNIAAAVTAYDMGTPTPCEVVIELREWSDVVTCHAKIMQGEAVAWIFKFVPQGWRPLAGRYAGRVWSQDSRGAPLLATIDGGVLIPRRDPVRP